MFHVFCLAAAMVLSGCGGVPLPAFGRLDLCKSISREEVGAALGSAPATLANGAETGSPHPECTWITEDDPPRVLTAAIWREAALVREGRTTAGEAFFAAELAALERSFPNVRLLGGVGDAAVIGIGDFEEERFTGGILVRQGSDVMALRIDGADPAAFEAVARKLAERL
jgi:hypothetical protein